MEAIAVALDHIAPPEGEVVDDVARLGDRGIQVGPGRARGSLRDRGGRPRAARPGAAGSRVRLRARLERARPARRGPARMPDAAAERTRQARGARLGGVRAAVEEPDAGRLVEARARAPGPRAPSPATSSAIVRARTISPASVSRPRSRLAGEERAEREAWARPVDQPDAALEREHLDGPGDPARRSPGVPAARRTRGARRRPGRRSPAASRTRPAPRRGGPRARRAGSRLRTRAARGGGSARSSGRGRSWRAGTFHDDRAAVGRAARCEP